MKPKKEGFINSAKDNSSTRTDSIREINRNKHGEFNNGKEYSYHKSNFDSKTEVSRNRKDRDRSRDRKDRDRSRDRYDRDRSRDRYDRDKSRGRKDRDRSRDRKEKR